MSSSLLPNPFEPGPRAVIPIFHEWIQQHRLDDELLIDVADYSHVHHGPGVLLMSHEAQYGLDQADGKLGLLYSRRRKGEGDVHVRLSAAFRAALRACHLLQEEPALDGKLRFRFRRSRVSHSRPSGRCAHAGGLRGGEEGNGSVSRRAL